MSTAKHDTGQISDGYHTFDELYRYRMLYHAWAVKAWLHAGCPVVKSKRHHDGEPCFGGGWFIVSAQLPSGQVSNHYEDKYWDLFECLEADRAPEWDGHTPNAAADRIEQALRHPALTHWESREGATDQDITRKYGYGRPVINAMRATISSETSTDTDQEGPEF